MPYLTQEQKNQLDKGVSPVTPGQLNYVLTQKAIDYLDAHNARNYSLLNEVVGVFECAKLEFVRRAVSTYEDAAIERNGDVYQ